MQRFYKCFVFVTVMSLCCAPVGHRSFRSDFSSPRETGRDVVMMLSSGQHEQQLNYECLMNSFKPHSLLVSLVKYMYIFVSHSFIIVVSNHNQIGRAHV